jgi:hypothetical protein
LSIKETHTKRRTITRPQRALVEECRCCHVNFDPNICAQCQVAGCAANAKGEKCRLSVQSRATQKLSPFQMRARIVELEQHLAEAIARGQELARLLNTKVSGEGSFGERTAA